MNWWIPADDPRLAQTDPVSRKVVEEVDRVRRQIVDAALLGCVIAALAGSVVQFVLGWRAIEAMGFFTADLLAAILTLATGLICWGLLRVARSGQVHVGIYGLIGLAFVFAGAFPLVFQLGLHAHSLNVLLPMIVFAALTLGPSGAKRITIASIALVFLIYAVDTISGNVHDGDPSGAVGDSRLVGHIAFITLCGWLSLRFAEMFRDALHKQFSVVAEQQRTVESLQATQETLRHSEYFLRLVADAIPGTVAYWNKDLVCEFANRGYANYMGISPHDMIGKRMEDVFPHKVFATASAAARRVMAGEAVQYEITGQRPDGTGWVGRMHYAADLHDGEARGCFVFGRDITDVRAVQKALESANAELAERTRQAEAASAAKTRFLATMSHEIRTPLNGILGMAQILQMPDIDERERVEFATTVLNSGRTLMLLLNDVLDLARIEAGRIDLGNEPFSPASIGQETVNLFASAAAEKGLTLTARWIGQAHARYVGDSLRLQQMLSNLVGNAVKFTEQGHIEVEMQEREREGDIAQVEFSVTDTGPGISDEDRARLFQPFTQLDDSVTRKAGGSGLGLSIVRQLVILMDGEIGVDSAPGKGSRFWFRVPAQCVSNLTHATADDAGLLAGKGDDGRSGEFSPDIELPMPSQAVASKLQGLRVLVVDDNDTAFKVAAAMLRRLGATPLRASNGLEAIDSVTGVRRPDIVLMDCRMPVMDGLTATQEIRVREHAAHLRAVPIIAMTANAFAQDRSNALAAGMDDFLVKPLDFDQLIAALTAHVRDT